MKNVHEMTSKVEVSRAYVNDLFEMSWIQIEEFLSGDDDTRELPSDSPLVAHAKACLRKLDLLDPRRKGSFRLAL